jgi:methylated-DNA-protein-cysteine methyltransferase-like protein
MAALQVESDVPWHRVVNARGEISRRSSDRTFERLQRILLEDEGVTFDRGGRVDLDRFSERLQRTRQTSRKSNSL